MAELKPCPFCGGGFRVNCRGAHEHDNENCFLHGKELKNAKDVEEWNTRKPMEAKVAELETEREEASRNFHHYDDPFYLGKTVGLERAVNVVRNGGKE